MDLLHTFQKNLADHRLPRHGESFVLAISGGPDSLAMLHLFARLRAEFDLDIHAVHLNHQIRGRDADTDARFVQETASAWGIPCRVEVIDVPALAADRRLSLEEAARQARYTVLGQAALNLGAEWIALAHNADDQVETVLMHFLRGTGPAGLRGMLPVSPLSDLHLLEPLDLPAGKSLNLLRPLLNIPRAQIEAYCTANDLSPRFDRSNLDTTYFRNRLRHEIIPLLETVNPNLRAMLGHTASVIAADYDLLESQVDAAWPGILTEESTSRIRFDLAAWRALPLSLKRATLRRAVWTLRRSLRDVSFRHVEDAVRVAESGQTGAQATLPGGLLLTVDYAALRIAGESMPPPDPGWPLLDPDATLTIKAPGEYDLPGSPGWRLSLRPHDGPWQALLADPWAAPLDAGALTFPLVLRTRRPGDRFQPQGMGGTKKVNAFQIDQKIPAAWRASLPLLADTDGRIIWVCGWRVDQRFTVGPATRRVLAARFERTPAG